MLTISPFLLISTPVTLRPGSEKGAGIAVPHLRRRDSYAIFATSRKNNAIPVEGGVCPS
jgi:hypothetical protein